MLFLNRSKYNPKIINPTEPVLAINSGAFPGSPPMYNPQPVIASTPPGIKGHQTKFGEMTREKNTIKNHPKEKAAIINPVFVSGLAATLVPQAI